MIDALSLWPPQASQYAREVDSLVFWLVALAVALSAPVFVLMAWFAFKYRRGKEANRKHPADRNVPLEVSWALIPFVLLLVFFVWATRLFISLDEPPADAMQVNVVAHRWMWKFQHPGGQQEINDLHVPVGEPVRPVMTSQDVIHSFYVPALRIKQDVLPGRYTSIWFAADRPGSYRLECAEFCGTDHSVMGGRLLVMKQADYGSWLRAAGTDGSLAARGAALFRSYGCSGCHGPSATIRAPPLDGLYGSPVPLADGRVVKADDQYIRDSILLPQSQVAAGYRPIMPTYGNLLREEDVLTLVAYIESLSTEPRRRPETAGRPAARSSAISMPGTPCARGC